MAEKFEKKKAIRYTYVNNWRKCWKLTHTHIQRNSLISKIAFFRYGRRSNWFKQYFQENELRSKRAAVIAATTSSPTPRSTSSEKCDRLSASDEELEPELESQLSTSPYSAFSAPLRYPSTAKDTIAAVTAAAAAAAASAFSDLPQTPVSSHLYLNCFPHLSLNQLVAYRHDSAKFLGPNAVPLTVLPNDHIHRYWDKLFEAQVHRPELAGECESEDPLDLSAGRQKGDSSAAKRTAPLDLSVKWNRWCTNSIICDAKTFLRLV